MVTILTIALFISIARIVVVSMQLIEANEDLKYTNGELNMSESSKEFYRKRFFDADERNDEIITLLENNGLTISNINYPKKELIKIKRNK